jgi:hypothetical protein
MKILPGRVRRGGKDLAIPSYKTGLKTAISMEATINGKSIYLSIRGGCYSRRGCFFKDRIKGDDSKNASQFK